jgi:hypothetical protein
LDALDELFVRNRCHLASIHFLLAPLDLFIGYIRSWWRQCAEELRSERGTFKFWKCQRVLLDFGEFHGIRIPAPL